MRVILELTTDNIISLCGLAGTVVTGILGIGIRLVSKQNDVLKAELDELRDCVQDTRLNYVTNERFDSAMHKVDAKLDKIMDLIASKPDKSFCDMVHNVNGLKK
jgi:hypothetical protein